MLSFALFFVVCFTTDLSSLPVVPFLSCPVLSFLMNLSSALPCLVVYMFLPYCLSIHSLSYSFPLPPLHFTYFSLFLSLLFSYSTFLSLSFLRFLRVFSQKRFAFWNLEAPSRCSIWTKKILKISLKTLSLQPSTSKLNHTCQNS